MTPSSLALVASLALHTSLAAAPCPADPPSPGADVAELYASLQQTAEASPFFAAAKAKHALTACEGVGDIDALSVTYTFGDGLTLQVSASPGAGSSAHALTFEQPEKSALALLAKEEKSFQPPKGCGINWKKPAESTTEGETTVKVYRAKEGNCSARVTVRGGKVIKVSLSGAS
jgi:hypothetical protein